jgi:hypothetical protein
MALSPRRHHRQHLWIVPRAPAERAPRARFTNPLWLAFGVAGGPLAWVFSYTLTSALISPSCSMSRSIILGMPSAQARELLIATVGALVAVAPGSSPGTSSDRWQGRMRRRLVARSDRPPSGRWAECS